MGQRMPGMDRPPSSTPNGGSITGQVQTTEIGPGNRPVAGIRVYFKTGKGADGSVFVPEDRYTAANVLAAVRAAANAMDEVHGATI